MKGIKYLIFGLMFILMGCAILIDPNINLGIIGEAAFFIVGVVFGIKGLTMDD